MFSRNLSGEAGYGSQASLAPMRIVTYRASVRTACSDWAGRSAACAAQRAKLKARPTIGGFCPRNRRKRLLVAGSVPVAQEPLPHSRNQKQLPTPAVIESPVDARDAVEL